MIQFCNANRFGEIIEREGYAVVPTIDPFDEIFGREGVRRMAVITGSHSLMGTAIPAVVYIPHNMAVNTGRRIIGKIGTPFGINEGVATQPHNAPEQAHEEQ